MSISKNKTALSAAQQDYIEVIYRLEQELGDTDVRISDIADRLGTRRPTVTRTVKKLTETGLVDHPTRGGVQLTATGRRIAGEIVHRHDDLVRFLVEILGLPDRVAQADAGQIEHGLSPASAQRLHEFLEFFDTLPDAERKPFERFLESVTGGKADFKHLPRNKTEGWRM